MYWLFRFAILSLFFSTGFAQQSPTFESRLGEGNQRNDNSIVQGNHSFNYLESCEAIAKAYSGARGAILYQAPVFGFLIEGQVVTELCEDQSRKSHRDRLANPNISSILAVPYPKSQVRTPILVTDFEPGRIRDQNLMQAVYGATEEEVRSQLVEVRFLNQNIMFNKNFGAAQALNRVNARLQQKVLTDRALANYLRPWLQGHLKLRGSTFDWRVIAGTNRLSTHSFGIAIDLLNGNLKEPYYWLWDYADQIVEKLRKAGKRVTREQVLKKLKENEILDYRPQNMIQIPIGLVQAFEEEGFIWGGKWFHFDAMHFEYRPEFFGGH